MEPPRGVGWKALPVTEDWVQPQLQKPESVKQTRERLQNLSWFLVFTEPASPDLLDL